jgi:hypothetical protein
VDIQHAHLGLDVSEGVVVRTADQLCRAHEPCLDLPPMVQQVWLFYADLNPTVELRLCGKVSTSLKLKR